MWAGNQLWMHTHIGDIDIPTCLTIGTNINSSKQAHYTQATSSNSHSTHTHTQTGIPCTGAIHS